MLTRTSTKALKALLMVAVCLNYTLISVRAWR